VIVVAGGFVPDVFVPK
jgi:hypothetical protein